MYELLIVLVLVGIVLTIAASSFRGLENELRNASNETSSFFRQTRSAAMANTSAYRVVVVSNTRLRTEIAASCSATTWQPDQRTMDLRDGVVMEGAFITAGTTVLCYGSRGIASTSRTFVLRDRKGRGESVQLFVGGAVTTTAIP